MSQLTQETGSIITKIQRLEAKNEALSAALKEFVVLLGFKTFIDTYDIDAAVLYEGTTAYKDQAIGLEEAISKGLYDAKTGARNKPIGKVISTKHDKTLRELGLDPKNYSDLQKLMIHALKSGAERDDILPYLTRENPSQLKKKRDGFLADLLKGCGSPLQESKQARGGYEIGAQLRENLAKRIQEIAPQVKGEIAEIYKSLSLKGADKDQEIAEKVKNLLASVIPEGAPEASSIVSKANSDSNPLPNVVPAADPTISAVKEADANSKNGWTAFFSAIAPPVLGGGIPALALSAKGSSVSASGDWGHYFNEMRNIDMNFGEFNPYEIIGMGVGVGCPISLAILFVIFLYGKRSKQSTEEMDSENSKSESEQRLSSVLIDFDQMTSWTGNCDDLPRDIGRGGVANE